MSDLVFESEISDMVAVEIEVPRFGDWTFNGAFLSLSPSTRRVGEFISEVGKTGREDYGREGSALPSVVLEQQQIPSFL